MKKAGVTVCLFCLQFCRKDYIFYILKYYDVNCYLYILIKNLKAMSKKIVIGLLGGMSPQSTSVYYQKINELYNLRKGGLNYPPILLSSIDMQEISNLQHQGSWKKLTDIIRAEYEFLYLYTDLVLICTNTMHKVVDMVISPSVFEELLDIRQVTVDAVKAASLESVLLLGTKFTMENDFYSGYLERNGIKVVVPDRKERDLVHSVIYDELCAGKIDERSSNQLDVITSKYCLSRHEAQGVVLACTELPLLPWTGTKSFRIPIFDTMQLHIQAAVDVMI